MNDTQYTNNDTYQQQLDIADVIVANKSDLYSPQDHLRVTTFFEHRKNIDCPVLLCRNGEVDVTYLHGKTEQITPIEQRSSSHRHETHKSPTLEQMPKEGFIKKINQGAGFVSVGWRFREDFVFDRNKVFAMLSGIGAERAKAVMNTDEGIRGYNLATGSLSEASLFGGGQSCIEIIGKQIDANWETDLLACVAETALAD